MLNWAWQRKSRALDDEPTHVWELFREQIGALSEEWPRGGKRRVVQLAKVRGQKGAAGALLVDIQRLLKPGQRYWRDVIIHGSVATGEVVSGWSDVDLLVIARESAWADAESFLRARACLRAVEERMYEFDPWQHHGVQVVAEDDLRFYPESWLPLVVLRHGASLLGAGKLTFSVRDSREEREERFQGIVKLFEQAVVAGELRHHGKDGVFLQDDFRNAAKTFYQFKYFVSVVLLLPSLWLELVEAPVFKKDSFYLIDEHFSEGDLELVRACEAVRRLSPTVKRRGSEIPREMQAALGVEYFKRAKRLSRRLWNAYEIT